MSNNTEHSCCEPTMKNDFSVNRLIGDIAILLARAINKENDANGVAQGYRAILFCLAKNDGVSQFEISKRVGIKPPTVCVALQKMETEGYVTRKVQSSDHRRSLVYLTEKGRKTVNDMMGVFFDCDKAIAAVLTPEELEILTKLLKVVKERINAEKKEAIPE